MQTITLPYPNDVADFFSHFAHLPYAILLDSCRDHQLQGRYDIIVADPTHLFTNPETIFEEIKTQIALLKKRQTMPRTENLPFTIGVVGYLSYDFGRYLEVLPSKAQNDIALPEVMAGIFEWSIVIDHDQRGAYLTATTIALQNKILRYLSQPPKKPSAFQLHEKLQPMITKVAYQKIFHAIKHHITEGNCYQINFAQRFSGKYLGDPWGAYCLLRKENPAPFSAFVRLPKGAILSFSPEKFLEVSDGCAITKPIKGTAKRLADSEEDLHAAQTLLRCQKNRAENVMIVDLLRNDLSKNCIAGSVQVKALCALESFKNVHHLVSTITGKLKKEKTTMDVLRSCFPGGSITGAPKIAAMKLIELLEPYRRSVYCGSIFYQDISGRLDSSIAIRTLLCDRDNIHCYAGGGIVYDSNVDDEYEECFAKVGNLLRALHRQERESTTTFSRKSAQKLKVRNEAE